MSARRWFAGRDASGGGDPRAQKKAGVGAGIRRAVMTALAVMVGGSSVVNACPVCFGAEETSMIEGTKLGILVLLVITLAVQGAFVGFFLYLRRRA